MHDGDDIVVDVEAGDIVVVLPPSEGYEDSAVALPQPRRSSLKLLAQEDVPWFEVDETKLHYANELARVVEPVRQLRLGHQLGHRAKPYRLG